MKKICFYVICACLFALLLAGCDHAKLNDNTTNTQSIEVAQEESNNSGVVYKTPSDAVEIDFTAEDPSNDQIQFRYDENNRIIQCQYQVDGHTVKLSYSYSESSIQIYAFSDEYVAADETFTVSSYDANAGFTSYNGYYFRGCVF